MQAIKRYWIFLVLFLLALAWTVGRIISNYNPLKNWTLVGDVGYQIDPKRYPYPMVMETSAFHGPAQCDPAMLYDVTNFLQTYPQKDRHAFAFWLYENGTGGHAVRFVVQVAPYTLCHYALFYDKDDKRVKVAKFGTIYAH